jgi:hypothetical protein
LHGEPEISGEYVAVYGVFAQKITKTTRIEEMNKGWIQPQIGMRLPQETDISIGSPRVY